MPDAHQQIGRAAIAATALVCIVAALAGCRPEPAPSATSRPSSSSSSSPSAPATSSPTASPTPSPTTGDALAMPATCDGVYTAAMLATLNADVAPLNDPGTTMVSTENVVGLEVLASGAPTIRCTWGPPPARGIATNVTIVSADQSAAIASALAGAGFASTELDGGTIYEIEQETITQDDELVTLGESHFLRGGGWISTRWINVHPDGYTSSIVEAVWG